MENNKRKLSDVGKVKPNKIGDTGMIAENHKYNGNNYKFEQYKNWGEENNSTDGIWNDT